METLLHNLSEVFAVSIIYSLWQCMLVYLVLRIVLSGIINFSASAKHNLSVAALYYATLWFLYTLFDQASHYNWVISNSVAFTAQPHLPLINTLKSFAHDSSRYEITIDRYLPYITLLYILGIVFHSLRLVSAWLQLRKLKQSIINDKRLSLTIERLSKQIRLKRQVLSGFSDRIDIPCIAGYLKPMVMLPLSLSTYLSAKEIETILLHELSHVKRSDYFINALQQVMSVVFFFNPFVYLINNLINLHRENACDDLVIETTNEPLIYAQALLKIEQNNTVNLPLALAATGKKYHLLTRIERIMKTKKPITNLRHVVVAVTILFASSLSLAWLNPAIGSGKLSVKAIKPAIKAMILAVQDSAPKPPTPPKHFPKVPKAPKSPRYTWTNKDGKTYYSYGYSEPKLEAMGKEMEQYGKQIDEYYNGPAFKKMQEEMELSGKKMDEYYSNRDYKDLQKSLEKTGKNIEHFYNSEGMKKLVAEQGELAKEYQKAYGGDQMKAISKQMKAQGEIMKNYFESEDFKSKDAELRKKYDIPEMTPRFDKDKNENQKKYEKELRTYLPQEVLSAQDQMKVLGEQMSNFYGSPNLKGVNKRMTALNDSIISLKNNSYIIGQTASIKKLGEMMKDYNNNPYFKNLQEKMKELGQQMRGYQNNPEIKEAQQKMKELGRKMHDYTQTPEFKKNKADWEKEHPDMVTPQESASNN